MSSGSGYSSFNPENNPYAPSNISESPLPEVRGEFTKLAGRGARLAASILDGLFQLLMLVPGFIGIVVGAVQNESEQNSGDIAFIVGIVLLGLGGLPFWGFKFISWLLEANPSERSCSKYKSSTLKPINRQAR